VQLLLLLLILPYCLFATRCGAIVNYREKNSKAGSLQLMSKRLKVFFHISFATFS